MRHQQRSTAVPPIVTLAVSGFIGLIVVFALDQFWDLPARSFGAILRPMRPHEFSAKVIAVLLLFILVLSVLRKTIHGIEHLSDMLTMCAWCRRVSMNGEWVSIDQFLQQRANTSSSVGVCPDCYSKSKAANNNAANNNAAA